MYLHKRWFIEEVYRERKVSKIVTKVSSPTGVHNIQPLTDVRDLEEGKGETC